MTRLSLTACEIDLDRGLASSPAGIKRLTTREIALLAYLRERPGQEISREELLVEVWGYQPGLLTRAVENTVARLRAKIERNPGEPEHLLTVHGVGYRLLPAPDPAPAPRSNLPAPVSRFFGRAALLAQLREQLLGSVRLVTLLGPGGSGKTRLSIVLGESLLEDLPGGVCFCALAEAQDADDVLHAVAEAVGAPVSAADAEAISLRLLRILRGRGEMLLILDNFEHLVECAPETAGRWLAAAPGLRILVTSRRRLQLQGETGIVMPPLAVADAAALFLDRARQMIPGEDPDTDAIHTLVQELDGIPLAIELAAGRSHMLTPRQLLDRLSQRFTLLRSTRKDIPARHASLQHAIDDSWAALGAARQRALSELSVFRGGFMLEAAEAVLGTDTIEQLDALCAHSMVVSSRTPHGLRLSLLETIRLYSAAKAADISSAAQRHAAYFLELGESLDTLRAPARAVEATGRLTLEQHNLRAAMSASEGSTAARIGLVLARFARLQGLQQRRQLIETAMSHAADPAVTSALLVERASLRRSRGDIAAARRDADEALALAQTIQSPSHTAAALLAQGLIARHADDHAAAESLAAAVIAMTRDTDDWFMASAAWQLLGAVSRHRGEQDRALEHFQEALSMLRAHRCPTGEGGLLTNIGLIALRRGELDTAEDAFRQGQRSADLTGDRITHARILGNRASLALRQGPLEEAERRLVRAIAAFRQVGESTDEALSLCNLGLVKLERDRPEEARQHLQAALDLLPDDSSRFIGSALLLAARAEHLAGRLDAAADRFTAGLERMSRVRRSDDEQARDHAMWAALLADQGHPEEAAAVLGAHERPADDMGRSAWRLAEAHIALARQTGPVDPDTPEVLPDIHGNRHGLLILRRARAARR